LKTKELEMAEMVSKQELYKGMAESVVKFEEDKVKTLAEKSLELGYDPVETILEGLSAGMLVVGDLFEKREYFVPEVLMCADAMQAGLDVLKPHIPKETGSKKGRVVIGTVQGDIHDIGKNIVKLMLEVGGFEVYDLGKDVPFEKFVEEMNRVKADIVGMSAMMTTTMLGMKKAVKMIRESDPQVAIMLGGAPVTPQVVTLFGADGYSKSAGTVLRDATALLEKTRRERKQS
jgi:corrinoid protein of di/trimethylamine methyltransferase